VIPAFFVAAFGLVCLTAALLLSFTPTGYTLTFPAFCAWQRRRLWARVALYAGVIALYASPIVALAQEAAAPLFQFDPVAIVQALPLSAAAKAGLLFALPLLYVAAVVARGFTSPSSPAGRVVRVVLDGWKHPDERGPSGPPVVTSGGNPGSDRG
jgi:hypothetical protein